MKKSKKYDNERQSDYDVMKTHHILAHEYTFTSRPSNHNNMKFILVSSTYLLFATIPSN